GQVPQDDRFLVVVSANIAGSSRGAAHQAGKVYVQDIAFQNLDVLLVGELHPQLGAEHAIEFNGYQLSSATGESFRQRALPGANLDHRRLRDIAERKHNPLSSAVISQKVLAQLRPW